MYCETVAMILGGQPSSRSMSRLFIPIHRADLYCFHEPPLTSAWTYKGSSSETAIALLFQVAIDPRLSKSVPVWGQRLLRTTHSGISEEHSYFSLIIQN